jgi:hypothetical protein
MNRTPVNGSISAKGFSNGFGMINGLTNGLKKPMGKTNGLKSQDSEPAKKSARFSGAQGLKAGRKKLAKSRAKRAVVPGIALGLIFLMLVLPPFLNSVFNSNLDNEPTMNWSNVTLYSDDTVSLNPNIDLKGYRAVTDKNFLWTYMMVEGTAFGDAAPDSSTAHVLIDADRNRDSGYSVAGMGADYMVKVYGHDGAIDEAKLYEFNKNRDRMDWNGWIRSGTSSASLFGNVLQTRTPLESIEDAEAPIVYFGFVDSEGVRDQSETPIDPKGQGGTLVVEQERVAADIVDKGIIDVMSLRFIANGRQITVNSVDITANQGNIIVPLSFPLVVNPDAPMTVRISMDTTALAEGAFIDVRLASHEDVESSADIALVSGNGVKAYVDSAPDAVSIDGAFGDWNAMTHTPVLDGEGETENPNVDMSEYLTASENTDAHFYVKVKGDIMAGARIPALSSRYVPLKISKPGVSSGEGVNVQTGSQESNPLPELTGEDGVYLFIDTDKDNATGYHPTHPFEFPIGADYMIEIKGSGGEVRSSGLFRHTGIDNPWDWGFIKNVRSECDADRLESGLGLADLGLTWSSFNVYFHIADWNGDEDYSDSVLSQSLAGLESIKADDPPEPKKNGGFGDGDIDVIDGGSCYQAFGCHTTEDDTQVPISFSMNPAPPYNPGQTGIQFQVTINMDNAASGSIAGVYVRVGPTGANGRTGIENDGWIITNDPNGGTNNFIERTGLVGAGATTLTWTVMAPSAGGTYYLEHCVHYDNDGAGRERNCIDEQSVVVIPEFPVDMIPIIAMMAVVLAILGKSRMGSKKE